MKRRKLTIQTIVLAVIVIGSVGWYLLRLHPGEAGLEIMSESCSIFSDLTQEDRARLSAQRSLVLREVQQRYGTLKFFRDERDLVVLQNFIDDEVFLPSQTYELQSLGIVFGDIFSARPEFTWTIGTDEYGRDPTLRYKDTSAQVNALIMISKRVERAEPVDVTELFTETIRYIEENNAEFDR